MHSSLLQFLATYVRTERKKGTFYKPHKNIIQYKKEKKIFFLLTCKHKFLWQTRAHVCGKMKRQQQNTLYEEEKNSLETDSEKIIKSIKLLCLLMFGMDTE